MNVSLGAAAASALLSVGIVAGVRRLYPGLVLLNVSEELAAVQGISAARYNFLYLTAMALIVSLGLVNVALFALARRARRS